jgi:hypothetical protein
VERLLVQLETRLRTMLRAERAVFAGVEKLAAEQAQARALQAGAESTTLSFAQSDNSVSNDIDGHMFFEAIVTAVASGPPLMLSD